MNYLEPRRLDALARDYALGTLAGRARRRFERVIHSQPAAAAAVQAWQQRLAVLGEGATPIEPRPQVWQAIERRVHGGTSTPASPQGTARRAPARWPLPWLGALAGFALCAVLLRWQPGWWGLETQTDGLPASYVGLLLNAQGQPGLLASSRRHGRQLSVKLLKPLAVPVGQTAWLWGLPRGGGEPVSLGPLALEGLAPGSSLTVTMRERSEALLSNVERLAVSLEAVPAARPGGPFVLEGHCVKLW